MKTKLFVLHSLTNTLINRRHRVFLLLSGGQRDREGEDTERERTAKERDRHGNRQTERGTDRGSEDREGSVCCCRI